MGERMLKRLCRYVCLPSLAGVLLFALAAQTPVQAGEGCKGECYERVPHPVIHRTFKRRITTQRGVYEVQRVPSQYGWVRRRILVDDGIEWREKPAVYKTVKIRKRVPSTHRWEMRWINGKYVKCKIRVPGKTVWAHKQVLVSPARRWKVRGKPVYDYAEERILLKPYKNIAVYHPERAYHVRERVTIQPEGSRWRKISEW